MDARKEGIIIASLLILIYIIAIPLTANISSKYTYDDVTFTYKNVKIFEGYTATTAYTFALHGPITFADSKPQVTINNTPVPVTRMLRNNTIYWAGVYSSKPTKVQIYDVTFKEYSPLAHREPFTYLFLSVLAVVGVTWLSTIRGRPFIKYRRLLILAIIILAFGIFSLESIHTYQTYGFNGFSFTATATLHYVKTGTIYTYTPFTAPMLPMGSTIAITLTGDHGTYTAHYFESLGYIFTLSTRENSLWISSQTATLSTGHRYLWMLAVVYTVIFIIMFFVILFLYSYIVFDVLDYSGEEIEEDNNKNEPDEEDNNKGNDDDNVETGDEKDSG